MQTALNGLASIDNIAPFASPSPYAGKVTVAANATDTVFTITFGGILQDQTLAPITALVTAGPGTATTQLLNSGFGQPTDVYTITFSGAAYAGKPQPVMTVSASSTSEMAVVSTVADGGVGGHCLQWRHASVGRQRHQHAGDRGTRSQRQRPASKATTAACATSAATPISGVARLPCRPAAPSAPRPARRCPSAA